MSIAFSISPSQVLRSGEKDINVFGNEADVNIDVEVVKAFGEEWNKFHAFKSNEVSQFGDEYFDIVDDKMLNGNSYVLDMGCGSGRFTKYIASKVNFVEAMDPSDAVYAASNMLNEVPNVRISKSSVDNIPFPDNTFDFVMSIGVLHHIPDTYEAMQKCVDKVKNGGYFFVYLYYALENRSLIFKGIFSIISVIRKAVSSLPPAIKKFVCDIIAILIYMPLKFLGNFFSAIGLKKAAELLPLSYYQNKSFFIIRNDALDRFGTKLEHRFSKAEITEMMQKAGLKDIVFSPNKPYWHAVGRK